MTYCTCKAPTKDKGIICGNCQGIKVKVKKK